MHVVMGVVLGAVGDDSFAVGYHCVFVGVVHETHDDFPAAQVHIRLKEGSRNLQNK